MLPVTGIWTVLLYQAHRTSAFVYNTGSSAFDILFRDRSALFSQLCSDLSRGFLIVLAELSAIDSGIAAMVHSATPANMQAHP